MRSDSERPAMTPEMDAVLAAIMGGSWPVDTIAEASHMALILVLRAAVRLRKQGLIDRMP
ncbi:MAG: hypothetical protein IBJ13_08745, partial [Sphingopyxis sp.]|nr:hypothetical protein [Sphingopyxis sp.]